MRITESQLRKIVREEASRLMEAGAPTGSTPGTDPTHPSLMPREFFTVVRGVMRELDREGTRNIGKVGTFFPNEEVLATLRFAREFGLLDLSLSDAGREWLAKYETSS